MDGAARAATLSNLAVLSQISSGGRRCRAGTVVKYMHRPRRPASQTWRTLLTNHVGQLMAADFFVVPTATCRLLFVLVILAHERRRVVHVAVTGRMQPCFSRR
jgi:hypothetical protein